MIAYDTGSSGKKDSCSSELTAEEDEGRRSVSSSSSNASRKRVLVGSLRDLGGAVAFCESFVVEAGWEGRVGAVSLLSFCFFVEERAMGPEFLGAGKSPKREVPALGFLAGRAASSSSSSSLALRARDGSVTLITLFFWLFCGCVVTFLLLFMLLLLLL